MPSLQESFPDAPPKVGEACRFYDEHYLSIGQWLLEPGKKIILRSSQAGTCRFCGLSEPKVTFKERGSRHPRVHRQSEPYHGLRV